MLTYLPYIKLVAQMNLVQTKFDRYIEMAIKNEGLDITKTRAMILNQIRFKGSVNQRTIADLNNISPQAIHRHIKILEEKKYIIRKKSKKDIREQNFILTKSGNILIQKTQKVFMKSVKEFFKNLTKTERKTLITILSKVEKFNIKKIISH